MDFLSIPCGKTLQQQITFWCVRHSSERLGSPIFVSAVIVTGEGIAGNTLLPRAPCNRERGSWATVSVKTGELLNNKKVGSSVQLLAFAGTASVRIEAYYCCSRSVSSSAPLYESLLYCCIATHPRSFLENAWSRRPLRWPARSSWAPPS